ncbi:hypothetical protein I4F81_000841 [Pyropia yezoensis]|uniref:Uncharacterized protein n=1 Tax=Pyropia yezoensis TaxID=2788 RepID=A0ACC3BKF4_PYRYE|nr:hypothetical protein I4F81_000841 [Neopyropia yezoensis]
MACHERRLSLASLPASSSATTRTRTPPLPPAHAPCKRQGQPWSDIPPLTASATQSPTQAPPLPTWTSDRRCGFIAKSADRCAASCTPRTAKRCPSAAMAPSSLLTRPAPSPTSTAQPLAAHPRTHHLPRIPRPSARTRVLPPCRTKYPQRPASSRRTASTHCPTTTPARMPRKRRRSTSCAPWGACAPGPPPRYRKERRSSTTSGGLHEKRTVATASRPRVPASASRATATGTRTATCPHRRPPHSAQSASSSQRPSSLASPSARRIFYAPTCSPMSCPSSCTWAPHRRRVIHSPSCGLFSASSTAKTTPAVTSTSPFRSASFPFPASPSGRRLRRSTYGPPTAP